MKLRQTIYYFLFLAVAIGAFASMAQNDYGLTVISVSCFLFSITIFVEFLIGIKHLSIFQKVEHLGLVVFIALFGLRAAYIHFPYVEYVLMITTLTLIIAFGYFGISNYKNIMQTNRQFSLIVIAYYLSITFFLASVFLRPVSALVSQGIGGFGGAFMGLFVLGAIFFRNQMVDGDQTTVISFIRNRSDHSSMLLTGFLLISLYVGFNQIGVLPSLYTSSAPKAYLELVEKAETGREEATDGKYQHDTFKQEYDRFVKRHKSK